jgi:predicted nucleic acid-binding Zn ribbon protein
MNSLRLIPTIELLSYGQRERTEALARYYANPNYCLQCGLVIEVKDGAKVAQVRTKKFCNHSCAGSYNNRLFQKRRKMKHCAICSIPVIVGRKYCSETCLKASQILRAEAKPNQSRKAGKSHYVVSWRQKVKLRAINYKGGRCQVCGYDKCVRALSFHHLDTTRKDFSIGGISKSWKTIQAEIDKCALLCMNCHAEVHAGLLNLKEHISL